jgi:hypothetical protein
MVNENIHNHPFEKFANKDRDNVVVLMHMVLSNTNSRDPKTKHESEGGSRVKLSCSYVESFLLDSRVSALGMSMAQKLSLELPEGHGLCSSEGDGGHSVSLESLGETNRETNFAPRTGYGWVATSLLDF